MRIFLIFTIVILTILKKQALADPSPCSSLYCQPCNNPSTCPECFLNGNKPSMREPCCQQVSHVLALTSASVHASAQAYAAAQATASAAVRTVISASAAASVGAFVSVCQSLSLSFNSGQCCSIAAEVQANASASAKAFAEAAAEAVAAAEACSSASAAASAAATAAASFVAQADSFINGSCCGFNIEVYSAVLAAGAFSLKAKSAAKAAVDVGVAAKDTAQVCLTASSIATAGTSSLVSAKIDNCCVNSHTNRIGSTTANAVLTVSNRARDLHGLTLITYEEIKRVSKDVEQLAAPLTLIDSICVNECKDVKLSCCMNNPSSLCCRNSQNTCCLASRTAAEVYIAAKAITQACVSVIAYAETKTAVFVEAITFAYAAANVSTAAAVSVNVQVPECCMIIVSIQTNALANSNAIAVAIAKAQAAASAYADAWSSAQAMSQAIADGVAKASASVDAYMNGCCGKSCCTPLRHYSKAMTISCCGMAESAIRAHSSDHVKLVAQASQRSQIIVKQSSSAIGGLSASDCANFIKRASVKKQYVVQCCCCTTKNSYSAESGYGGQYY